MRAKLIEVLACPKCAGDLTCAATREAGGEIEEGRLTCSGCGAAYPVTNGIPRFVEPDNYAASFGYQWNLFRREQLDSANGTDLSARRLFSETGWTPDWMAGRWILDAGCGAGRFLDVAAKTGAEVVGLDISSAIDASKASLAGRSNVHFVQASIYEPPFRAGAFDGCYCIGVVQHTPDPQRAMAALPRVLRAGGRIAVTAYERKPWTMLYGKYLVRPLTKRLDKRKLLAGLRRTMPVLFPVTDVLFRLPAVGRLFMFTIPVANYVNEPALTREQRYQWAVLDTFDMLSPEYDQPRTQAEIESALSGAGVVGLRRLPSGGVTVVGERAGVRGAAARGGQ